MKNTLLKFMILVYLTHAPLTYSMECLSLEGAPHAQFKAPKNIALALGVIAISYFGYRLVRSWQKTTGRVIKLNRVNAQEVQTFIERVKQELTKENQDFRFIYDYQIIWNQIALPVYKTLEKQNDNSEFVPRGVVKDDQGKVLFELRGNIGGLELKIISANYCIVMDIQDAAKRLFGSEYYKRLAERHVAHYSVDLLQAFNELIKQIKQEQIKLEHERNYAFVTQKLAQLNDVNRSLFISYLISNNGDTLQSLQNIGTPKYDYPLATALMG